MVKGRIAGRTRLGPVHGSWSSPAQDRSVRDSGNGGPSAGDRRKMDGQHEGSRHQIPRRSTTILISISTPIHIFG